MKKTPLIQIIPHANDKFTIFCDAPLCSNIYAYTKDQADEKWEEHVKLHESNEPK